MIPLLDIAGHQSVTITLEDIQFESATMANSTSMFRLGASPLWEIEGYWVHDDATWKWRTTRSAACAVMAKYGGECDPGDDDSPWAGEQPATVTPVIPEGARYHESLDCDELIEPEGDAYRFLPPGDESEGAIVCFEGDPGGPDTSGVAIRSP